MLNLTGSLAKARAEWVPPEPDWPRRDRADIVAEIDREVAWTKGHREFRGPWHEFEYKMSLGDLVVLTEGSCTRR